MVKNLPANARNAGDTGLIPGSGKIPWRRKWQPTSVFLRRKSRGQKNLAGSFGGPKRVEHNLMTERACSVWKLQNITKQCQLDEAYHSG